MTKLSLFILTLDGASKIAGGLAGEPHRASLVVLPLGYIRRELTRAEG